MVVVEPGRNRQATEVRVALAVEGGTSDMLSLAVCLFLAASMPGSTASPSSRRQLA